MKKQYFYRCLFYVLGLLILALGLSLNTKTGLGVTPIVSVSFGISTIWNLNFGNVTFVLYGSFVLVEMVLHSIQRDKKNRKLALVMDLLQFPLSLVFTRFLNVFTRIIPDLQETYPEQFIGSFPGRILVLLLAIILTGLGVALSLNMRLIPNPGDGIAQAISDFTGKSMGFVKNCVDGCNLLIAIIISMIFAGHLIGVGIGTVLAVIGVGRVIAVCNHLFQEKITKAAGVE